MDKNKAKSHFRLRFRFLVTCAARAMVLFGLAILVFVPLSWNYLMTQALTTELNMNDFGKFYYSAAAFLQGKDMYAPSPATMAPVGNFSYKEFWNMNPPHFHLLLLPLALMSLEMAFVLWGAANLLALAASLLLIFREVRIKATPGVALITLIGLVSFAGTGAILITGQLSWLLLLPVTIAWMEARRGRWGRAGIYIGLCMSVKPFLLIFIPYMLLRRELRAASAACGIASLCFIIGFLVFGMESHRAWLQTLRTVDWEWASMNGSLTGLLARSIAESPSFKPAADLPSLIRPIWLAVAGILGAATVASSSADYSKNGIDRGFALLLVGSQLISPLGWIYYLWLPFGPMAALVHGWWQKRDSDGASNIRWRNGLFLASVPGLIWPNFATRIFQPGSLATITIGSVYFWSTLLLWASLMTDFISEKKSS